MMWPFKKRKTEVPPIQESPKAREDLLLGDNNKTWTINDYVIYPDLDNFCDEMDRSLQELFEKGSLDAENGNFFDDEIDALVTIALYDLNAQQDIRPEGINKMVAWREHDVTELSSKVAKHEANKEKAEAELEAYVARYEQISNKKFSFTKKREVKNNEE